MGPLDTLKNLALTALIGAAVFANKPSAAYATEYDTLTVAGGCFWCVESDFESLSGVIKAESGYTGGTVANPTYKQVGKGNTGHYEAVKITFDPVKVSRKTLLEKFFRSIDPTDAGGQLCDRGAPYRSAVFVSNKGEQKIADAVKAAAQKALGQTIVTPVLNATEFYAAEDYHQDYYKGQNLVITRFGPLRQSKAYKRYREVCGRDARVQQLWGSAAAFTH